MYHNYDEFSYFTFYRKGVFNINLKTYNKIDGDDSGGSSDSSSSDWEGSSQDQGETEAGNDDD